MPAILVNDVSPVISYTATAGQTLFSIPFEFFAVQDIVVERAGVTLTYSPTPANNNQFSVIGANLEGGGSITLGSPGATLGDKIVIFRDIAIERLANYPETGPMAVRSLNAEQAKHIGMMQQLERDVNRGVTVPIGESSIDLPSAAERAEKILTFDAAGAPVTEFDIGLLTGAVISSGAAPAQNIEFTATASQTVFNFVYDAIPTYVSVFLNGVKLPSTDFTHSGTTVTLLTPATVGDRVALEGFTQSAVLEALATLGLSSGSSLVGHIASGTGAVARTVQAKLRDMVCVFDFMSAAQIADVQAYTYGLDVTSSINTAIDYAYRNKLQLNLPAGGYSVTQIVLPDDPAVDPRAYGFEFVGAGRGEAFVYLNPRGTVIRGTDPTKATIKFTQTGPSQGSGVLLIHNIRFEGTQNSGVPVADFEALYGASRLFDCDFYQSGAGDGLNIGLMATGTVSHCYIINGALISGQPSWVLSGVQPRTGTGLKLTGDLNCGLATFEKITSRGWEWAYDMGDPTNTISLFSTRMNDCEVSVCTNGVRIRSRQRKMIVDGCYFEGIYGGKVILNEGDYTTITNCEIGASGTTGGYTVGIDDSSTSNFGTIITNNDIQCNAQSACVLIAVSSTAAFGGPNKVVTGNSLIWSQSGAAYAGIVGLSVTGITPRVNYTGNAFLPRGPWVGGAGTNKILDATQISGSTSLFDLSGQGVVPNGNQEFQLLGSSILTYGIPETTLVDANVTGNLLTVSRASFLQVELTSAANIFFFSKMNYGQVTTVYTKNANMTFKQGNNLKLSGSVDYTPGANGAALTFICVGQTGTYPICREIARTVY